MIEYLKLVLPEFTGGLLALICAVVGAEIATKSNERQHRRRELQNAYASVFSGYYACMVEMSAKNLLELVSAMEMTCLICSPASERTIRETVSILAKDPLDGEKLGGQIQLLREQAKKDIAQK